MAIPGSIVASGKLVTPGGAAGPLGPPGPNAVSTDSGNIAVLGSDNLILVPQSTIWNQRLRSFNSVGNPNFEVDQRNCFGGLSYPAGNNGRLQCDRWNIARNAATAVVAAYATTGGKTFIPGTNFVISQSSLNINVSTPQATLAPGEYLYINQFVEGPQLRELIGDVHSISLIATCTVPLTFSVQLGSATAAYTLVKSVSILANTPTLVTLPNLPIWAPGGTWSTAPGNVGYSLLIGLAVGTTYQGPLNSWQSGNFMGFAGQSNFLANAGATFTLSMVQHEPGPLCTTLQDKPFSQNYDECLRLYSKSYDYGTIAGTVTTAGIRSWLSRTAPGANGSVYFYKPLARGGFTTTLYDHSNGAAGSVMDGASVHHTGATINFSNTTSLSDMAFTTATTTTQVVWFHYTVDTGW